MTASLQQQGETSPHPRPPPTARTDADFNTLSDIYNISISITLYQATMNNRDSCSSVTWRRKVLLVVRRGDLRGCALRAELSGVLEHSPVLRRFHPHTFLKCDKLTSQRDESDSLDRIHLLAPSARVARTHSICHSVNVFSVNEEPQGPAPIG